MGSSSGNGASVRLGHLPCCSRPRCCLSVLTLLCCAALYLFWHHLSSYSASPVSWPGGHDDDLDRRRGTTPPFVDFIDPDQSYLWRMFYSVGLANRAGGPGVSSFAGEGGEERGGGGDQSTGVNITVFHGQDGEQQHLDACVPFHVPGNQTMRICVYEREVDPMISAALRDQGVWEKEQVEDMALLLRRDDADIDVTVRRRAINTRALSSAGRYIHEKDMAFPLRRDHANIDRTVRRRVMNARRALSSASGSAGRRYIEDEDMAFLFGSEDDDDDDADIDRTVKRVGGQALRSGRHVEENASDPFQFRSQNLTKPPSSGRGWKDETWDNKRRRVNGQVALRADRDTEGENADHSNQVRSHNLAKPGNAGNQDETWDKRRGVIDQALTSGRNMDEEEDTADHSQVLNLTKSRAGEDEAKDSRRLSLVDVGCNVGVYTLTAATLGHPALAVDPVRSSLQLLHASLRLADLRGRVTLLLNALSDRPGPVHVHLDPANVGGSSVSQVQGRAQEENLPTVWALCLDHLVPLVPTRRVLLKLDIEGWEARALRCAADFFQRLDVRFVLMEWLFLRHRRAGAGVIDFMTHNGLLPYADVTQTGGVLSPDSYYSWPDNVWWMKR